MIFFSALLVPLLYFRHRLDRLVGLALLLAYGAYIFWVL
jgi:hypothetical protein